MEETFEVNGVLFVRKKQVKGEKGVCVGCAFNTAGIAEEFGEGCVKYSEVCDVDKTGNMIIFKKQE